MYIYGKFEGDKLHRMCNTFVQYLVGKTIFYRGSTFQLYSQEYEYVGDCRCSDKNPQSNNKEARRNVTSKKKKKLLKRRNVALVGEDTNLRICKFNFRSNFFLEWSYESGKKVELINEGTV